MKTLLICAIIVAGAAAFGSTRHNHIAELRRQNVELRQRVDEVKRYEVEAATIKDVAIDTNELKQLRAELPELMKMRSEIGRLRQLTQIEVPTIQREVESTAQQIAQAEKRGADLLAERAAKVHSKITREQLSYVAGSLFHLARANGGRFPGSMDEVETMLKAVPEQERKWVSRVLTESNRSSERETAIIGRSFSVSMRDFEFVPSSKPVTIQDPAAFVLREITPRQLPDGSFARCYGFADQHVDEAISPDGNFSEWEREKSQAKPEQ